MRLTISALAIAVSLTACNEVKPIEATLELVDRHASGLFDEGAAEIVAFHAASGSAFVTNANDGTLDQIDLSNLPSEAPITPYSVANLKSSSLPLPETVTFTSGETIQVGGANSVAIATNLMAVAVQAKVKQDAGAVLFYSLDQTGTPVFLKAVKAGALPDMVTFSPNGKLVLVANEGEPNDNYTIDPEGSISIVEVRNNVPADTATQLTFAEFNGTLPNGVLVGNNPAPESTTHAQDFEPEYITVSKDNKWAFVSLQENNAIAKIKLTGDYEITNVYGLGFKDHSQESNALDADKDDKIALLKTHANLFGRYQPDSIASYSVNNKQYIVTANEGDAREYIDDRIAEADCNAAAQNDMRSNTTYLWDDACIVYKDEWKIKDLNDSSAPHATASFSNATSALLNDVEDLAVSPDLGYNASANRYDSLYSFGARSFSIFSDTGELVFDSGSDFERITAEAYPEFFNTTDNKTKLDDRSDNKGPEPEALTLAYVEGHTLAIIGLERMGGLMMYDITDPENVEFLQYVNHRDYTADPESPAAGDLAPEGMAFVAAQESPNGKPLVLVANEVSGTLAVYQLNVTVK